MSPGENLDVTRCSLRRAAQWRARDMGFPIAIDHGASVSAQDPDGRIALAAGGGVRCRAAPASSPALIERGADAQRAPRLPNGRTALTLSPPSVATSRSPTWLVKGWCAAESRRRSLRR